jgi:hypothetical protein
LSQRLYYSAALKKEECQMTLPVGEGPRMTVQPLPQLVNSYAISRARIHDLIKRESEKQNRWRFKEEIMRRATIEAIIR